MSKIYVGIIASGKHVTFRSNVIPTQKSHGHLYNYVIGPFRTMLGAKFMRDYGQGNPHCCCVADAEKLAQKWKATGRMM